MKNILLNLGFLVLFFSQNAFANEENHRIDHDGQIFHAFTLGADSGEARDGNVQSWDLNGWVGGDYNRLWLKSEGLAPQSFETEIHGFLSEDGDFSLRLRREVDIFLTQWLITQTYLELEAFSQDVENKQIESGISRVEIGIITRKFAPYFALKYDSKTFSTADLAKKNGNRVNDFSAAIGIKLRF